MSPRGCARGGSAIAKPSSKDWSAPPRRSSRRSPGRRPAKSSSAWREGVASADGHAAVDAEHVAGHEAAAGAEQVEHRVVELPCAATAPQRSALEQEVREPLGVVAELRGHLRREEAGRDGVDADAVPPPL